MFRRIALHIKTRKDQKELLAACAEKPEGLRTFGPVFVRWGTKVKLGKNVTFFPNVVLWGGGTVIIGDNASIGDRTMIYVSPKDQVVIGSDTLIAANCFITDTEHNIAKGELIRTQGTSFSSFSIGHDCWIGANVSVLEGSIIHDGAVIGAGAVVKGEIPENAIAVGVPAKVIKFRK
jgi:acetyltransferase-like isoleucine patch superfamily enzyme